MKLEWKVTEQQNIAEYVVEYSKDARTFTEAGRIPAGISAQATYQYQSARMPDVKRAYYRLRILETDGSYAYSRIISIVSKSAINTTVYPVPAHAVIWLSGAGLSGSEAHLTDMKGYVLQHIPLASDLQQVDISALQPGIYFIRTAFDVSLKFVKE